jgi:dihydropteroate synthase
LSWLENQRAVWQAAELDIGNIIFDPGVGFGKTALQNQEIIKQTASLRQQGFRLLIGHSRKSFMNNFATQDFADRDIETMGLSLAMCEQGVDIIRVHDPLSHIRAYRAWAQIRAS